MRSAIVVVAALWTAAAAGAGTVQLPSPTARIGLQPPLGSSTPAGPVQLPRPPRADNSQQVLVDVSGSGRIARIRVRQRLTMKGLGDFFFQVPAPVRDVRRLPESQSDPGLRRAAIVWQGFSPGRRVLAAELELDPAAAARALPLRLERRPGGVALRNVTSVAAPGFVGRVSRPSARRALERAASLASAAPSVQVDGATRRLRLRVDAPLRIRGAVTRRGRVVRRFGLVLGGPRPAQATIDAPPDADVQLTAEPTPLVSDLTRAPRDARAQELLLRAERALFRLARVNQYRSFLASPATGRSDAVYRFRTVAESEARPAPDRNGDDRSLALLVALVVAGLLGFVGAVVAWAHL